MKNLSRRNLLGLAAGTIAAAALPAVAATSSERHWVSSHWLGTPLDNTREVVTIFQGLRSDNRMFHAIRSLNQDYDHKRFLRESEHLRMEIQSHVEGFLRSDCMCGMPEPGPVDEVMFFVSETQCPFHKQFYYDNNWLKSSWDRARRKHGTRGLEAGRDIV